MQRTSRTKIVYLQIAKGLAWRTLNTERAEAQRTPRCRFQRGQGEYRSGLICAPEREGWYVATERCRPVCRSGGHRRKGSGSGRRPVVWLTLWTACLEVAQPREREGCLASRDSIHFILPRGCKRNCAPCAFSWLFCAFFWWREGHSKDRCSPRQVRGARQSLVSFQLACDPWCRKRRPSG